MSLKERLKQDVKLENKIEDKIEIKPEKKIVKKNIQKNGLGVIEPLLFDSEINSIYVQGAQDIRIIRNAKVYESTLAYRDNIQLESIIKKTACDFGFEINRKNPFLKFKYKEGVSVTMMLPPLVNKPSIFIKCFKGAFASFDVLLEQKSLSKEIASYLDYILNNKENIIIAGPKNSLKTTLLLALAKKNLLHKKEILIDFKGEVQNPELSYFDFSSVNNKKEIIDLNFRFEFDNIFINDPDNELSLFICDLLKGLRGVVITLEAKNKEEVIDKLVDAILKVKPYYGYEGAKNAAAGIFKHIIFTNEERKISLVTSINEFFNTQDVFYINETLEHKSCDNPDYVHNYIVEDKKSVDILQKFKKKHPDDFDDTLFDEKIDE